MNRHSTADKAGSPDPPKSRMIHVTEKIGNKRHMTPEGFMLCEDVPIARVGWMIYGPGETPIKTNDAGYATISRSADTLFHPTTIASFAGKSVTLTHPQGGQGVTPENWSKVTKGTAHNLRRGAGDDADVLLADLLITDAQTIKAVRDGLVEVSAGYDADYETTGPGEGRQVRIIGNHIALVERGRCGPRCAIGDHQSPPLSPLEGTEMPQAARRAISPDKRKLILDAAAALAADPEEEGDDNDAGVHIHLHGDAANGATGDAESESQRTADANDARFEAIETTLAAVADTLKQLVKTKTDDEAQQEAAAAEGDPEASDKQKGKPGQGAATGDSTALESSFKALVADAEVLVPGFRVPTFDAKADRKVTVDSMCLLRRRALDTVYSTAEGSSLVNTVAGHTSDKALEMTTMDCAAISGLFKSAAGAKRLLNNRAATGDAHRVPAEARSGGVKPPMSIAAIQEMNRKAHPLDPLKV